MDNLSSQPARLLHEGFLRSARHHGSRQAMVCGQSAVTYAALERISLQLSHLLLGSGVAKGDRVGIYLPKSIEAAACILGILRCGATYVPLDVTSPVARTSTVVMDCQIRFLFATPALMDALLAALDGTARDCLRELIVPIGDQASVTPVSQRSDQVSLYSWSAADAVAPGAAGDTHTEAPTAEDLAYILYTSGSTGAPKGVCISHRAARAFVDWSSA